MAKTQLAQRQSNITTSKGRGVSVENHASFDDSLLPDAVELGRLKELDPNVVDWVKDRTAIEQDARIDLNKRKVAIIEKDQIYRYNIDRIALVFAFLIVVFAMGISGFLIYMGQVITGSIFAGATIILAANAFLKFRKNLPERIKKG